MDGLIQKLADYLIALPDNIDDVPFNDIEEAIGLQLPKEAEEHSWWDRFLLLSNSDIEFGRLGPSRSDQHSLSVNKYRQISNYRGMARSKEVFLERWELTDQEDNFPFVINRVMNVCTDFFNVFSSEPMYLTLFCTFIGKSLPDRAGDHARMIYKLIAETKNVSELAYLLQMLFIVLNHFENFYAMKELKMKLLNVLDITSNPPFFLDTDIVHGEINLYKSGAELLDNDLVNDSLHWLSKYPEVRRLFTNALENYSKDNATDVDARNIYDDLRTSLEKLIQLILGNSRTLEKNKNEIEKWLKDKGTHVQVINQFNFILHSYTTFMNDAKHASKYNSNDLEFMIYQTGIMMRMLLEKERT